jgi:ribonuclease P protein component
MERLKRRTDFKAAAQAQKAPTGAFVLQARQRSVEAIGPVRVGFTVSRRVGNAVERNRVRRRLREMVRLAPAEAFRCGHDYVVIGRRSALETAFTDMARQFAAALRRVHAEPGSGQERPAAEPSGGSGAGLHRAGSPTGRGSRAEHASFRDQRKDGN